LWYTKFYNRLAENLGVSPRMKAIDYKREKNYMNKEDVRFSADSFKLDLESRGLSVRGSL